MQLETTLTRLTEGNGGILAADESTPTLTKRFASVDLPCTEANRNAYRRLLLTTPHLEDYINGVILSSETIQQKNSNGELFATQLANQKILTGIKLDEGLIAFPGNPQENITKGLTGLAEKIVRYQKLGASFSKWRAAFTIKTPAYPSIQVIRENAERLAQYAACCQSKEMLPIIEPELLREGSHCIQTAQQITEILLNEVFNALVRHGVSLRYVILKVHMVNAGTQDTHIPPTANEIARHTLEALRHTVPPIVPSIHFLSGGHTPQEATRYLQALYGHPIEKPWRLSFSYGRALQAEALRQWKGNVHNQKAAQEALYQAAKHNYQATQDPLFNTKA